MSTFLLIIRDGRDEYHERSIQSARWALPAFEHEIVIDDRDHSLGFAGAIQAGWEQALATDCEYIFHLEADFIFNARPPVDAMRKILDGNPDLAQVVLKRQAWNVAEIEAGGIIEQHPEDYATVEAAGQSWTEHDRFFSTNPSIYPRAIAEIGWPQVPQSEGIFTQTLRDHGYRFAFFGAPNWPPFVAHIGADRRGRGY